MLHLNYKLLWGSNKTFGPLTFAVELDQKITQYFAKMGNTTVSQTVALNSYNIINATQGNAHNSRPLSVPFLFPASGNVNLTAIPGSLEY